MWSLLTLFSAFQPQNKAPKIKKCVCVRACRFTSVCVYSAPLHVSSLLLQSSEPAEGASSAGTGVSQSASGGGRVPYGAQIQKGPGAEAEDPPPGAFPAAAAGWPLPHRGVPGRNLWGKGRKPKLGCILKLKWRKHYEINEKTEKEREALDLLVVFTSFCCVVQWRCRPWNSRFLTPTSPVTEFLLCRRLQGYWWKQCSGSTCSTLCDPAEVCTGMCWNSCVS